MDMKTLGVEGNVNRLRSRNTRPVCVSAMRLFYVMYLSGSHVKRVNKWVIDLMGKIRHTGRQEKRFRESLYESDKKRCKTGKISLSRPYKHSITG